MDGSKFVSLLSQLFVGTYRISSRRWLGVGYFCHAGDRIVRQIRADDGRNMTTGGYVPTDASTSHAPREDLARCPELWSWLVRTFTPA